LPHFHGILIIICQDRFVKGVNEKMIVFDKLWETMREKGISTYVLREKCGIDSKTVRRIRSNACPR
jgi:hypothetical protein